MPALKSLPQAPMQSDKIHGIFRGVVEDNKDPKLAGRCRIRIWGVHSAEKAQTDTDGVPTNHLPWAEPVCGLIEGSVSKYGLFSVPLQGSHVFVFFEGGNIMQPRYFATVPAIPANAPQPNAGFNDPDGMYPEVAKLYQPDWHKGTKGTYPHVIVLGTHGGHLMEIDSTPGAIEYRVVHPAGTILNVDNAGNVTLTVAASRTININIDNTVNIKGNDTLRVTGDKSESISGSRVETVQGSKMETILGDVAATINGGLTEVISGNNTQTTSGTVTINSGVSVVVNAPSVKLGSGSRRKLLNDLAATIYNGHTHGGSPAPSQQMTTSEMTSVTEGA